MIRWLKRFFVSTRKFEIVTWKIQLLVFGHEHGQPIFFGHLQLPNYVIKKIWSLIMVTKFCSGGPKFFWNFFSCLIDNVHSSKDWEKKNHYPKNVNHYPNFLVVNFQSPTWVIEKFGSLTMATKNCWPNYYFWSPQGLQ